MGKSRDKTQSKSQSKLSPASLKAKIAAEFPELAFEFRTRVTSTNALLKEQATNIDRDKILLAAEQTAGRGRLNHAWSSPANQGLYFSILLSLNIEPEKTPFVTGIAALSLYKTLRSQGFPVEMKWPNDILLKGKKVAGILAEAINSREENQEKNKETELQETSSTKNQPPKVIVGIGLNTVRTDFPEDLGKKATSLKKYLLEDRVSFDSGDSEKILLNFLSQFYYQLEKYQQGQEREVVAQWKETLNLLGRKITIATKDETITGQVKNVTERGELILITARGEEKKYWSGEITIKKG